MKRFLNHRLLYVLLSSLIACTIQAIKLEDSPFSFGQKYRGEKFLIAGCGWDKVAVIDNRTCRFEWVHTIGKGEDCNDTLCLYRRCATYHTGAACRLGL